MALLLADRGCIYTGIMIRGFEVWTWPPHHYRHYHTLVLRVPGEFPTEPYYDRDRWVVGFVRPDGQRQVSYCSFESHEAAEQMRVAHPTAELATSFEVGYRKVDGTACGGARCDPKYGDYAPFAFDFTPEEAQKVIDWREAADVAWFAAHPNFLPQEKLILAAQVAGLSATVAEMMVDARQAFGDTAVVAITSGENPLTECLECGAAYDTPGHVEPGGMACDRCG